MGRSPGRGQEQSDHYMAPLSDATPVLACMKAIQEQCFKLGIPLKTRHREVAPGQFEFAPLFGSVVTQIDQNLLVMQIIEETAAKFGLAALLQEKPFQGINGSGKHNNWSISTAEGVQLLNPAQMLAKTSNPDVFPVVMAALVAGLDLHGDLLRMAISSPGNDFRLGAMEAPPAVISTYLGADMTAYLERFVGGASEAYTPRTVKLSFGVDAIAPIDIPAEDRNRTSPFPCAHTAAAVRPVARVCSRSTHLMHRFRRRRALRVPRRGLLPERVAGEHVPQHAHRRRVRAHLRPGGGGREAARSGPRPPEGALRRHITAAAAAALHPPPRVVWVFVVFRTLAEEFRARRSTSAWCSTATATTRGGRKRLTRAASGASTRGWRRRSASPPPKTWTSSPATRSSRPMSAPRARRCCWGTTRAPSRRRRSPWRANPLHVHISQKTELTYILFVGGHDQPARHPVRQGGRPGRAAARAEGGGGCGCGGGARAARCGGAFPPSLTASGHLFFCLVFSRLSHPPGFAEPTRILQEPATAARVLRLETMIAARKTVDAAEAVVPADMWTLATYKEARRNFFLYSWFFVT